MSSSGDQSRATHSAAVRTGLRVHVGKTFGGGGVVSVAGELDASTAESLDDALWLASVTPGDRLVLDMSRLTFIDAAGIGVVLAAHERLVAAGEGGLVVRAAWGLVRRVFELTALTALLEDRLSADSSPDVSADGRSSELDSARRRAGLSVADLFVAYFALGGQADLGQLVAYLNGDGRALDRHQGDIAVHAVNERLVDVGRTDQLLAYASA